MSVLVSFKFIIIRGSEYYKHTRQDHQLITIKIWSV